MKKLIIGKNSRIIKEITSRLVDFDIVSHTDIENINFSKYSMVFLFSFCKSNADDNIRMIDRIPTSKLIYISTIATYSTLVRRQYASYPNLKLTLEKYVFSNGGKILRLGVWGNDNNEKISTNYQCTSTHALIEHLNKVDSSHQRIVDLYDIRRGSGHIGTHVVRVLRYLDKTLPNFLTIKAPLIFALRKHNIADYGYSADAFSLCNVELVIGEGCLGSAYLYKDPENKVVISPSGPNINLTKNGFSNTLVSLTRFGLSALWHRVYVDRKSGRAIKRFDVRRHSHRVKRINAAALHLDLTNIVINVGSPTIISKSLSDYRIWDLKDEFYFGIKFSKVTLAAGSLMNAALLTPYLEENLCYLSDHKTCCLGYVDTTEVSSKFAETKFLFIRHISFDNLEVEYNRILLDFRPFSTDKSGDVYRNGFFTIVWKLLISGSFYRINEAVYNRFKLGIRTRRLAIWAQIEDYSSIKFENGKLSRSANFNIEAVLQQLETKYFTFSREESASFTDSQHVVWSPTKMRDIYHERVRMGKLKILGSQPEGFDLGSDHHTVILRNQILSNKASND